MVDTASKRSHVSSVAAHVYGVIILGDNADTLLVSLSGESVNGKRLEGVHQSDPSDWSD